MATDFRDRSALWSYLSIQVAWCLLVLLTPVAMGIHMGIHPSRLWAAPFEFITMAGGLHLTYFRHEYNALVGRVTELLPVFRRVMPRRCDPEYYLPLGIAYTLFGVASVTLVVFHLDPAPLLQHLR
jgi:hypothetical protein